MNIYLVSQKRPEGCERTESFVCVSKDEDEARRMHPMGILQNIDEEGRFEIPAGVEDPDKYWGWSESSENVNVELLGPADRRFTETRVLCTSY